jgi:hypothetical protein
MKTPAAAALRNATAFRSSHGSVELPPIEKLTTSTRSIVAWLIALSVPVAGQPVMQTL